MRTVLEKAVDVATIIACIVAAVVGVSRLYQAAPVTSDVAAVDRINDLILPLRDTAVMGRRDARMAIVEFADFQCRYCAQFAAHTLDSVRKAFVDNGKAVYAFRNFPIGQIHPFAGKAAQAALCAGQQRQFWPMHDRLFGNIDALAEEDLRRHARELGLSADQFGDCLARSSIGPLEEDIREANLANVAVTPTFFIGRLRPDGTVLARVRIRGAQPLSVFENAIKEAF